MTRADNDCSQVQWKWIHRADEDINLKPLFKRTCMKKLLHVLRMHWALQPSTHPPTHSSPPPSPPIKTNNCMNLAKVSVQFCLFHFVCVCVMETLSKTWPCFHFVAQISNKNRQVHIGSNLFLTPLHNISIFFLMWPGLQLLNVFNKGPDIRALKLVNFMVQFSKLTSKSSKHSTSIFFFHSKGIYIIK